MNKEIFEALHLLESERNIPMDFMIEKIKKAIVTACKNSYDGNDEAVININEELGTFEVGIMKEVVEDVLVKGKEIELSDARQIDANASLGEKIVVPLDTKEFGRIAAQTARNIIRQGIKDGERTQLTQEFQDKKHQIVSALVERVDPNNGSLTLRIGRAESMLPLNERVGINDVKEGDHIKVYVADVQEGDKGPRVLVSRTSPDFVKRLFEMEVPELVKKEIEIKAVSREAGSRTKMAVMSNDEDIDAIGACIGSHGVRINAVVQELGGEKIDIIKFSDSPEEFIKEALLPAHALEVKLNPDRVKTYTAVVPDNELSLAIGSKGQNVRLAARLTGYRIDLKPESGFYGE